MIILDTRRSINKMQSVADTVITDDKDIKIEFPQSKEIVTVSREDFVAKYHAWSTNKTLKLLNDNKYKLLYVKNAETLRLNDKDVFGDEALLAIKAFMGIHPGEINIIFEFRGKPLSSRDFFYKIMEM